MTSWEVKEGRRNEGKDMSTDILILQRDTIDEMRNGDRIIFKLQRDQ